MSDRFYKDLRSFADRREICDLRHYREVPDGWVVVISDVEDSTKAIEGGRYRDVNLVGAATITAARNAAPDLDMPYVFGGDGATLLIPAARLPDVKLALLGLREIARERFQLGLRVGGVGTEALRRDGSVVLIGKLEIAPGVCLAMFGGGGLAHAEAQIKGDRTLLYDDPAPPEPNLDGLECRWRPLASERGEMLSVLVRATPAADTDPGPTYRAVIDEIGEVVGAHDRLNPVSESKLRLALGPAAVGKEHRLKHRRGESLLRRLLAVLRLWMVTHVGGHFMRTRKITGVTDWGRYQDSIARHSDYWKYDDTLRFVIDVTPEQHAALTACFVRREARGEIVFGVHAAKEALMTCVVFDRDLNHVHFIDGGDGGYALAAKQLKSKLR